MTETYRGVEVVRVKDDTTRDEYTIEKRFVVDGLTVLDKPALAPNGKPAPPKNHVVVRKSGSKKKSEASSPGAEAGQTSANTKKE